MKTIFTLLLSSIFSIASFAYDGPLLTVSTIGNQKVYVEVDGRKYNMRSDNTVSIRNIYPGTHTVRVLREVKNRGGWNIRLGNPRTEVIYAIKATLKDGYDFDIVVNRFGKVMIDERRIDDWYDENDDDYYDNDDRNNDDRYDNRNNRDDRDRDWDNNRNNRNNDNRYDDRNNRNDRDYRNYEMSDADFSRAKESLRKEWFENTRLSTARQIIDQNYFTSNQVRDLMLLFTFENNRLDIAKYAYKKTVDQRNYFQVNDALSMPSNKEELSRFIREQQ